MASSPARIAGRRSISLSLSVALLGASVATVAAAPPPKPPPAPVVVWTPASVDVTIVRGASTSASASFATSKKLPNVTITDAGGTASFVTVSPGSIMSAPGGNPITITLAVAVPASTLPGVYAGSVVVSSGKKAVTNSLPVTIRVLPEPGISRIATGVSHHTCALTNAGGVKCWGYNATGDLGDGTTTDRSLPVDVSGLGSGIVAVAGGQNHTCALTGVGGIKCWGFNGRGELGDGTLTTRLTPVDVVGLSSGVVAISAGFEHTCALTNAGGVKCWGLNFDGELGNGTRIDSAIPVDVSGLGGGVIAISVSNQSSCALTSAGGVKCWGLNGQYQLGDGTFVGKTTPVDVTGLTSGVTAIALGNFHACALTSAGGVKCWGINTFGQAGNGTALPATTPVDVIGLGSGVAAISAGGWHSCALSTTGGASCWGWNAEGQLGTGNVADSTIPIAVSGLSTDVLGIAAGLQHTCAVMVGAGSKCWGYNAYGQLGNGTTVNSLVPSDVAL